MVALASIYGLHSTTDIILQHGLIGAHGTENFFPTSLRILQSATPTKPPIHTFTNPRFVWLTELYPFPDCSTKTTTDHPSASPSIVLTKNPSKSPSQSSLKISRKTPSNDPSLHLFSRPRKFHKNNSATHLFHIHIHRTFFPTPNLPPILYTHP